MKFHEFLAIPRQLRSYLEIGVQEGHSLRAVVQANPTLERIAVCDDWGTRYGGSGRGDHGHIAVMLDQMGCQADVVWLDGDSREQLPGAAGMKFDMIVVDGDHSEAGVECDLMNADGLLASGGIIVVHDTANAKHPEIRGVVERFADMTDRVDEYHTDGEGFAVVQ